MERRSQEIISCNSLFSNYSRTNRSGLSRQPRQKSLDGAAVPHLVKMADMPPTDPDWFKKAMPPREPDWLKGGLKKRSTKEHIHPDDYLPAEPDSSELPKKIADSFPLPPPKAGRMAAEPDSPELQKKSTKEHMPNGIHHKVQNNAWTVCALL